MVYTYIYVVRGMHRGRLDRQTPPPLIVLALRMYNNVVTEGLMYIYMYFALHYYIIHLGMYTPICYKLIAPATHGEDLQLTARIRGPPPAHYLILCIIILGGDII